MESVSSGLVIGCNLSVPLIAPGGTAVLFGAASGLPVRIDERAMEERGIRFLRPRMSDALPDRGSLKVGAEEVFEAHRSGVFGELRPMVYPLSEVAEAHGDLEGRRTRGSVVLRP